MEDQVENTYLLQMPTLVIEKILSNVLNLTNVSYTCKALYDTVCQMEKRKRVACIIRCDPTNCDNYDECSTIDDDVVFDSIVTSHRTITNIQLDGGYRRKYVELNGRQWKRVTAIVKHFGANITSLVLRAVSLSIYEIIELLNKTPKLESLEFDYGMAFGFVTTTLHLSSLKKLSIRNYRGLLEIVNFLPSGSLNDFRSDFFLQLDNQQVVQTILSKQHNLKSLRIDDLSDPTVLCVNHLQLEKLELGINVYRNDDQLIEILKCHSNLKELRFWISDGKRLLQPSAFEWICENLNELEVLRVAVDSPGKYVYSMLGKLKKLRYFSTNVETAIPDAKFPVRIDSLTKLEIYGSVWSRSNEECNKMVQSMVRTFTDLTALDLPLQDFSQLNTVLSQCTKLIHLTSHIDFSEDIPSSHHHFAEKSFPTIRHLTIITSYDIEVSVITSIVRTMPNLRSLLMPYIRIKFNANTVKEFILASKSLEDLELGGFELDQDLSPIDGFVEIIRRLSDHLKAYRFRFKACDVPAVYFKALKDVLSDEFNDRGSKTKIVLCKGVLSDFHGYP